ncbi:hypothetical protein SGPA1_11460 [Streptomyces misionensis JCM 4497]
MVRAQRLVQGRAGPPSEPQGPPVGRQPHLHRHLPRAPLAGRREPARADPAYPLRAVLRAFRLRGLHRGPGPARRPPLALHVQRRPALDRPADRRPARRVLPQRPDARPARLPRQLPGPVRGPLPDRAHAALAGARPRHPRRARARLPARLPQARPPVQAGAGTAGVDHPDVPPVGRPVRWRPAPQGRRRPAARGHRPAPGAPARGHHPQALQGRRRARRTGRLDVVRRRPPAHRAEVLRPRPARRQGGGRPAARLVHPLQHEPPDDPPGPARRRPGTDPPRPVRQPRLREPARPGDAVCDGGPRLRQHGPARPDQARGPDGRGHLRRGRGVGRAGPRLDPLLLRGRAVRGELALLPRPRLCRRAQPHLRLPRRAADAAGGGTVRQGRRAPAVVRAQPDRHGHRAPAPGRARGRHGVRLAGHDCGQEGPLRTGEQPYPKDGRHGRARPRRPRRRGRPDRTARRRPPGRRGRLTPAPPEPRPRPDLPNRPTRLPQRQVIERSAPRPACERRGRRAHARHRPVDARHRRDHAR